MALDDKLGALASGFSVNDAIETYLATAERERFTSPPPPPDEEARAESEAVVEIMYLLAAVDGQVADDELAQLRTSVRELAQVGVLSDLDPDILVPTLTARLDAEGWRVRLHTAATRLLAPDVRRLAYRLAAGVAFVDDEVEPAEAAALDTL